MSHHTRVGLLWVVVAVAFLNAITAASSNGAGGGSAGAFVGAGALSAIIRQRRRREAWLDHLEWHRRNGTHCPDERDGEPPAWGVPPPH